MTALLVLAVTLASLSIIVFCFGDWPANRRLSIMDVVTLALGLRLLFRSTTGAGPSLPELAFLLTFALMHLGTKLLWPGARGAKVQGK